MMVRSGGGMPGTAELRIFLNQVRTGAVVNDVRLERWQLDAARLAYRENLISWQDHRIALIAPGRAWLGLPQPAAEAAE